MEVEVSPTPPTAAASSSPEASQENDQTHANFAEALGRAPPVKQGSPFPVTVDGRKRSAEAPRAAPPKGRSKNKPAIAPGSNGTAGGCGSKFVSPEAVLEAAREIKEKLPEVSSELLDSLRARGLEPCTLKEVLEERGVQWAVTQMLDERAEAEHARLLEAFQRQCEGWGNNREGWVHNKWNSVIVCPDFKRGGLQVSRSSMREMWNSIMSVVSGFVCPDLLVCRVTDPTHPVRFATPPNESCFTVVYAGKEPIKACKDRKILGEYTGHVRAGNANEQRFEYVFDLSFCALAWRAAEEFEKDSDTSGDEGSPDAANLPVSSAFSEAPRKRKKDNVTKDTETEQPSEGKRRVQVTGSQNIKRVALPVRGELVLDSHDACNQMSLVNHYGTIGLLGERVCHVNTEWQQVFVDGWPHIVLTTIPGVAIEPGDEVLADFGYDWFNRVQDASHKAIARELLDYRIGAKTGGCQTLAPARRPECVVRDSDTSLQTRARMGEVCPYCHSDEIPIVSPAPTKVTAKISRGRGYGTGAKNKENDETDKQSQAQQGETRRTKNTGKAPAWGEQVVHCDGCDRPCHLRCIFGNHSIDQRRLQPEQQEQQAPHTEQQEQAPQDEQQEQTLQDEPHQPSPQNELEQQTPQAEQRNHQHAAGDDASGELSAGTTKGNEVNGAADDDAVIDSVDGGESVEDIYRWFVEGDCKWYCCVCRLQWERMAAAMNFSIDWKARAILREGNPLLLPTPNKAALRMPRIEEEPDLKGNDTGIDTLDCPAGANKRRRKCPGGTSIVKCQKVGEASPHFTRSLKGLAAAAAEPEKPSGSPLSVATGTCGAKAETDNVVALQDNSIKGVQSGMGEMVPAEPLAPTSAAAVGGTLEKRTNMSDDCQKCPQAGIQPIAASEGVAGLSTAASESPISGADSETQLKSENVGSAHIAGQSEECAPNICNGDSEVASAGVAAGATGRTPPEGTFQRRAEGLVVEEAMRVYKDSSEKSRTSKMQPCPVAVNPAELTSEELLGCRTHMLVEPRALLGSLQPCVRCYKLYGAKASVEVCRLTKRHVASNWDHPNFASPAQIQDALLTCFQDALLTVQRDHREKLQRVFESMSPLEREVNMKALISGNRYPRIHANAARRNAENTQSQDVDCTPVITKGMIPLLCVTLGKTKVDFQFPDPETKKLKWFHGCVTNYQAVARDVKPVKAAGKRKSGATNGMEKEKTKEGEKEERITYFTNQFCIEYNDGDHQTVPPKELIAMLIQTGPGSKLAGRKSITTTPLVKMLAPELTKANRQVNYLVRQTNRKASVADLDSDSDEE